MYFGDIPHMHVVKKYFSRFSKVPFLYFHHTLKGTSAVAICHRAVCRYTDVVLVAVPYSPVTPRCCSLFTEIQFMNLCDGSSPRSLHVWQVAWRLRPWSSWSFVWRTGLDPVSVQASLAVDGISDLLCTTLVLSYLRLENKFYSLLGWCNICVCHGFQ